MTSAIECAKLKQCFNLAWGGGGITRSGSYITKQREAILAYMASLGGTHVTVTQLVEHFARAGTSVGRTTIYRYLDKLAAEGKVRRYITDSVAAACYQYVDTGGQGVSCCDSHLHLKCEGCGELWHLECETLNSLEKHVLDEHAFQVNTLKTVLYGKCDSCLHKESSIR